MIVGVKEAKTKHEIAHLIANAYAYGIQSPFYEMVEEIYEAIQIAQELPDNEISSSLPAGGRVSHSSSANRKRT